MNTDTKITTDAESGERLFTGDQVVELFQVTKEWLYRHIHFGTLPFPYLKVGGHLRFPSKGLHDYVERETRKPKRLV